MSARRPPSRRTPLSSIIWKGKILACGFWLRVLLLCNTLEQFATLALGFIFGSPLADKPERLWLGRLELTHRFNHRRLSFCSQHCRWCYSPLPHKPSSIIFLPNDSASILPSLSTHHILIPHSSFFFPHQLCYCLPTSVQQFFFFLSASSNPSSTFLCVVPMAGKAFSWMVGVWEFLSVPVLLLLSHYHPLLIWKMADRQTGSVTVFRNDPSC